VGVSGSGGGIALAFVFSAFVNLLMLSAPLYMLQVYDRVLVSRSVETLLALTLLLVGLYLAMGLLDFARGRIMARVGARLQAGLESRVLNAAFRRLSVAPQDTAAHAAERDLDALSRFWASPALLALFDLPWTPLFFAALFIFHPWLGCFAVGGGLVLTLASWANQRATDPYLQTATLAGREADRLSGSLRQEPELIRAMGMAAAASDRWRASRAFARVAGLAAADASGRWSVTIRTFRLFLQSAMLGLAAWLVLREELSAGAMVAASILMGRALQPIEQTVAHWSVFAHARQARARLSDLLGQVPLDPPRTALPRPAARLEVQGLTIIPPGSRAPTLRAVSFSLMPGQVMGVIGPSGSGKSTLAKALIGAWRPVAGQIRLDGATLDQHDPERLGRWIGYLPQAVALFDGTIAENIARLQPDIDPHDIIEAARAAGAHDMILRLPEGYDTRLSFGSGRLSGGQSQRIGLARAIFGNPVLLVLDEPNASLDHDGAEALNQALRAARSTGAAVLIMSHRPAALQECDLLLVLKDGMVSAVGPRDQVLRETVKNAGHLTRNIAGASG
jgi:ATP-binding cassette subfamily C protein